MEFKNRKEAGQILALRLNKYKDAEAVVLAIPRGGVPLGYAIADALNLPLDVVLSKKIGHPEHKEFAIGAVTLKNRILGEAASQVTLDYIEDETIKLREKLKAKQDFYYDSGSPINLKDKILIVVDDGVATGNTMLSVVEMLSQDKPKKIIVAIPVSEKGSLQELKDSPYIDEVICLLLPNHFMAVGQFYENFEQVEDAVVTQLLNIANAELNN